MKKNEKQTDRYVELLRLPFLYVDHFPKLGYYDSF